MLGPSWARFASAKTWQPQPLLAPAGPGHRLNVVHPPHHLLVFLPRKVNAHKSARHGESCSDIWGLPEKTQQARCSQFPMMHR